MTRLRSTFELHTNIELTSLDYKVLALLYQPIAGMFAMSLYQLFFQLQCNISPKKFTHHLITDLLNIKEAQFIKAKEQLEALNLIETYQKENHYIYVIKMPLTPKQFLKDTIFGSFLKSEIGEQNFNEITECFKSNVVDLNSYENISKTFDELYEFQTSELLELTHELEGKLQNGGSYIKFQFDYDGFIDLLPERMKEAYLLTPKAKDEITKIAFVYQFDIEDMATIFQMSHQKGNHVTYSQLNMKASQYYKTQKQKITIKEKDLSQAELLSKVTPKVIVSKYAKPEFASLALHTASTLMERNQVEIGIVNVMLMFILKHKEGNCPPINYMEKVLEDWIKKGVLTTEDALAHTLKLELDHKPSPIDYKQKKKAKDPDWLDAYLKDLEQMEG